MDLFTLDDHGDPVPCDDLGRWAATDCRIAYTMVGGDGGRVSTVFLPFRCRGFDGPAFETMTFDVPGLEYATEQYATRADAVAGHARAVQAAQLAIAQAPTVLR